jgi:hypothetical protein
MVWSLTRALQLLNTKVPDRTTLSCSAPTLCILSPLVSPLVQCEHVAQKLRVARSEQPNMPLPPKLITPPTLQRIQCTSVLPLRMKMYIVPVLWQVPTNAVPRAIF